MHAQWEEAEEKQTQRVTPVKKVDQNTPDMQVALPRCMNAMAVHCGAPITATRLSPIISMDQLERAVSHTHVTMIPLKPSCGAAVAYIHSAGTAQAKGDGASSLRPGWQLAYCYYYFSTQLGPATRRSSETREWLLV
jgi:hypothetical protein